MEESFANETAHDSLQFLAAVTKFILPAVKRYELVPTCMEARRARFESSSVTLDVEVDSYSHEISVIFLHKELSGPVTLADVRDWKTAGHVATERVFFQASSAPRLHECIAGIAGMIVDCASEVLSGSRPVFEDVARFAARRDAARTLKVMNQPIREAAEAAWHTQDFGKALKAYELLASDLTPVEKARLAYLRGRNP